METVAQAAGVHRTTVSLALKGHASIPQATQKRIRDIAEKLGYRPNPLVAALMTNRRSKHQKDGKTGISTIAYITRDSVREVVQQASRTTAYSLIYSGARKRAEELGFHLELFQLSSNEVSDKRLSHILYHRGIRGVLVGPSEAEALELNLDWKHFSPVAIGSGLKAPHVHRVSHHYYQGALLAMQSCQQLGLQRVGFVVNHRAEHRIDHAWLAGYLVGQRQFLKKNRLEPLLDFENNTAEEALFKWLKTKKPDCVIGLIRGKVKVILEQHQQQHPDFKIVDLAYYSSTGNTCGVDQCNWQVGQTAVTMVVRLLQQNEVGIPEYPEHLQLEGRWIDEAP